MILTHTPIQRGRNKLTLRPLLFYVVYSLMHIRGFQMNLIAHMTLNLPNASEEKRNEFYNNLSCKLCETVDDYTTKWMFESEGSLILSSVLEFLKEELIVAKKNSGIVYVASITFSYTPIKLVG